MLAKPQLRLIFLSLFISSVSFSMENLQKQEAYVDSYSSDEDEACIGDKLKSFESVPNSNFETFKPMISNNRSPEQNSNQKNNLNKLYCGTPKEDLDEIFEVAPPEAQDIVNMLNYPHLFYTGGCRVACLTGAPGGGKSTLAKAIAYKAGWDCKFIVPMDVKREGRGVTAIQLRNTLMDVVNSKKKTVIVVDEFNRLVEKYNSEHNDTDETSDAIWTFLDAQIYNELIFVIATMNRADKIPPQLKSRARSFAVEIPSLIPAALQNILIKKLSNNSAQLHQECTSEVVNELLLPFKSCSGRDIESVASSAIRIFRRTNMNSEIAIIEKTHLEEALSNLTHVHNTLYKIERKEDETEVERQERHHKEGFEHSKKLHDEGLDKQDELFVQNAFLQLTMKSIDRSEHINTGTNDSINIGLNPGFNWGENNGISVTRQIVLASDYEAIKMGWSNKQVQLLDAKLAEAQIRVAAAQVQAVEEQAQAQELPQEQQNEPAQPGEQNQPEQPDQEAHPRTTRDRLKDAVTDTMKQSAVVGGVGGTAAMATIIMGAPVLVPIAVIGITTMGTTAIVTKGAEEIVKITVEKTADVMKSVATAAITTTGRVVENVATVAINKTGEIAESITATTGRVVENVTTTAINKTGDVSTELIHATERVINNTCSIQ